MELTDLQSKCDIKKNKLIAISTPSAQVFVLSTFSSKKNQGFLEKCLIPGLGQETFKVILEHLMVQKQENASERTGACQSIQEPA